MSLKIVLPFALLAFGSSATATAGIYSHTSGSGKGPNRDGAGNGKVLHTPDNHRPGNDNPTSQRQTSVTTGAPEKKQAAQTPTVDEASPKETPDNGTSSPSVESAVETTPTLEGGKDQGQKDGASDSSSGDSLPKDGTGETDKQSGDPKRTEVSEQPSDQGAQDHVARHTDNSKPKAEPGAGNPSPAAGDNADQKAPISGGQGEQTGHQDGSNKEQGVAAPGGSAGETATPSGAGSDSKGTPPSTSNPAS